MDSRPVPVLRVVETCDGIFSQRLSQRLSRMNDTIVSSQWRAYIVYTYSAVIWLRLVKIFNPCEMWISG